MTLCATSYHTSSRDRPRLVLRPPCLLSRLFPRPWGFAMPRHPPPRWSFVTRISAFLKPGTHVATRTLSRNGPCSREIDIVTNNLLPDNALQLPIVRSTSHVSSLAACVPTVPGVALFLFLVGSRVQQVGSLHSFLYQPLPTLHLSISR